MHSRNQISCTGDRGGESIWRLLPLAFLGLLIAASSAEAQVGGQLFATSGDVEVEVLPASAGFTSELRLCEPGPEMSIATNREEGKIVDLGTFPAGVELVFCIFVQNTGQKYFMGPAVRNPDGEFHAEVIEVAAGVFNVGFEDQLGGGDMDYDDNIFQFRGGITTVPVPTMPQWTLGGLVVLLVIGSLASLRARLGSGGGSGQAPEPGIDPGIEF